VRAGPMTATTLAANSLSVCVPTAGRSRIRQNVLTHFIPRRRRPLDSVIDVILEEETISGAQLMDVVRRSTEVPGISVPVSSREV